MRTTLDPSQRAVVDLPVETSAVVLGAPGTGKTTTLVELVADRVLGGAVPVDGVLVLTQGRLQATRLRDRLALRLGVATTGPLARTLNSFAFQIVREAAMRAGAPSPRLLTGGEQDADLAALLEGHRVDGTGPEWPAVLGPEVRALRTFRTELRELMMRMTEHDVDTARLRRLAAGGHPEWDAAADLIDEFHTLLAFDSAQQLDAAELAAFAANAMADDLEVVERVRLVVVDDLQELTRSGLTILRALAARRVPIVAFGDPDVAANAFRGGEPDAVGRFGLRTGVEGAQTLVLSTAHRQSPELRALTAAVTERIGTAAAGAQRAAVAGASGPDDVAAISRIEAPTTAREWAAVGRLLREEHLLRGLGWDSMAVVVRSGAQIAGIRRALALAEVPTRSTAAGAPLRDDRAARALLTVVDVGIGRAELTPEIATELLLGPFGGLDRLELRRLRLALRAEEIAGGGRRPSDELVVEALQAPERLATIDHRVGRVARRMAVTLAELREHGGSIEELLWHVWERSGLATAWREQALGGGVTAAEADRDLDGVLALFTAAKRYAERRPGEPPTSFLAEVLDAEVPEDTLSPQPLGATVLVTTPSGAVGLEFDTVVVGGLQDGAWPNLRLRNSLLAPHELVRAVEHGGEASGLPEETFDERRLVLHDELRMFALAVSRARRRVVLAAVANDDEAPSRLLGLVPDAPLENAASGPFTLRGQVGMLRRRLLDPHAPAARRAEAASALAALAEEGVAGADPQRWHGLVEPSTTGPLFEGDRVPVSPSSMSKVAEGALDWFLERIAASDSGPIAAVGTILHWAMETAEDPSVDALWSAVEARWGELLFEAPWLAERQKRLARRLAGGIAEYLGDFAQGGGSLVGAESRFRLEIDEIDVSGSIDRVERAGDGSVVIVDLKTGNPITKKDEIAEHPQLAAYQLAYAEGRLDAALAELGEHRAGGAKLLFVKSGVRGKTYREGVQPALDAVGLDAFRDRVRQVATIIAAAEFEGSVEVKTYGAQGLNALTLHRVGSVSGD